MNPSLRVERVLLWIGLLLTDTAAQLLFKSAAVRLEEPTLTFAWVAMVAQTPGVWAAIACLLLTFGFWMLILRRAALSAAFPITALTLVGVVAGSWLFFREAVAPVQYAGIALIVAGVALLRPDRVEPVEGATSSSS
jgi:multidrug transporter EmrE-like cation transporter